MRSTRSAALGLGYPLWLRLRWGALAALAYLAVAAAAAPWLRPAETDVPAVAPLTPAAALTAAVAQSPLAGVLVAAPLLLAMARLLAASTYGSADLTARQAGFPAHMLVLPLPTRSLVGWPMLFSTAGMTIAWLLLARLVLVPAGVPVRILWPAAMVCAVTAWVQAIVWWPFGAPLVRAVCVTLALLALGGFAAWATNADYSPALMTTAYGLATLAAFLVARTGVRRARNGAHHGDPAGMLRRLPRVPAAASTSGPAAPFRSSSAAQFWYERRRNALLFPVLCAACLAPMLLPLAAGPRSARAPLLIHGLEVSPTVAILLAGAAAPVFMAAALSAVLGKSDAFATDIRFAPFLATRPLSTGRFVAAKVKAAAFATLLTWLALLALLSAAAAVGALRSPGRSPLLGLLHEGLSAIGPFRLLAALVLLMLLTWRNLVLGLFATLYGRRRVSTTLSLVFTTGWLVAIFGGLFLYSHPGLQPHLAAALPWAIRTLIAFKAIAVATACVLLLRTRLIGPRALTLWILLWAAVVASCGLGVCRYVPTTPLLIEWLVLLVPFTRIALAPLALSANRHG